MATPLSWLYSRPDSSPLLFGWGVLLYVLGAAFRILGAAFQSTFPPGYCCAAGTNHDGRIWLV